jgi:flagellin
MNVSLNKEHLMKVSSSSNTQTLNLITQNKSQTDAMLEKINATKELSGKDGANLVVSDALASQMAALSQGVQNANETIGMYQIADASIQAIQSGTDKLNDLSVRFNSATLGSEQKASLQKEFSSISSSMQDIAAQTTYNGQNLLNSNYGLDVSGLSDLTINDQKNIATFRDNLSSLSSTISSQMNSASSSINSSLTAMTNLSSANAQISEKPLDQKIAEINSDQIKLSSSILTQIHQNSMMQQNISALLV